MVELRRTGEGSSPRIIVPITGIYAAGLQSLTRSPTTTAQLVTPAYLCPPGTTPVRLMSRVRFDSPGYSQSPNRYIVPQMAQIHRAAHAPRERLHYVPISLPVQRSVTPRANDGTYPMTVSPGQPGPQRHFAALSKLPPKPKPILGRRSPWRNHPSKPTRRELQMERKALLATLPCSLACKTGFCEQALGESHMDCDNPWQRCEVSERVRQRDESWVKPTSGLHAMCTRWRCAHKNCLRKAACDPNSCPAQLGSHPHPQQ